jgi:hypothetical protein
VARLLAVIANGADGFIDWLDQHFSIRRGGLRARCGGWARSRRWLKTRNWFAPRNKERINAPIFIGTVAVAGHPPTQPAACGNEWQVHNSCHKAIRVTAPSLTTGNWATPVGANCAVIAAPTTKLSPTARMPWNVFPPSKLTSSTPPSKPNLGPRPMRKVTEMSLICSEESRKELKPICLHILR